MMSEFDEDGGGTIDFPEFRSFICKNELKSLIDKIEESAGGVMMCRRFGSNRRRILWMAQYPDVSVFCGRS